MVTPILALFVSFLCIVGAAKAQEPNVTVTLDPETTVVGQPVVLRIKVLVPTWMPKPPVFPNFEVPSVMVRLPERASGPVSETIDRETWSGVQRAYRLYPLEAGVITLPAGVIGLTYAEPGATVPRPQAAAALSPAPPATTTELDIPHLEARGGFNIPDTALPSINLGM